MCPSRTKGSCYKDEKALSCNANWGESRDLRVLLWWECSGGRTRDKSSLQTARFGKNSILTPKHQLNPETAPDCRAVGVTGRNSSCSPHPLCSCGWYLMFGEGGGQQNNTSSKVLHQAAGECPPAPASGLWRSLRYEFN